MTMWNAVKLGISLSLVLVGAGCSSTSKSSDGGYPYQENYKEFNVGALADDSPVGGLFISKDYVPAIDAMRYGVTRETSSGWDEVFAPDYAGITPLSDA